MVTRRRFSKGGYTLVEVMITVGVLALIAGVFVPLLIHAARYFMMHRAKIEIQRDARVCLDTINKFVRQANAASVVIDQATGQPSHSRVSFTTYAGRNVVFYQDGRILYQVMGSTVVLTDKLRFVAFSYPRSDDPTILSVALTTERAIFEGRSKALELSIEKVRVMN